MVDIIEKKKKLFNRVFGMKYSLKLLGMQAWDDKDGRELAEVSFIFGELMTAFRIIRANSREAAIDKFEAVSENIDPIYEDENAKEEIDVRELNDCDEGDVDY